MISIIICSTHHDIGEGLKDNIKTTIGDGVDYEIVCIDNSDNRYSIFSAYNDGVKRAKGEYLCFMHEDIIFHSADWGGEIVEALKDGKVGMLGVIGTAYFSQYSRGWFDSVSQSKYGKVIQGYTVTGKYKSKWMRCNSEIENNVVAVDGLWMCIRKELFDKHVIMFDEITFKAFHFYDLDICMQVLQTGRYIKIVDIDIEHKSLGNLNRQFYDDCITFHSKWNDKLPVCADKSKMQDYKKLEDIVLIKRRCGLEMQNKEYNKIMNQFLHKVATKLYLLLNKHKG